MTALIPLFFIVSVIYSSVGLGGGSAYITIMVLAGIGQHEIPVIALACNLIVAGEAFIRFRQAGHFRWNLLWPLALTSIPAAYIGATLKISDKIFTITLASALAVAALRLLFFNSPSTCHSEDRALKKLECSERGDIPRSIVISLIGAALGLLAGITGIGGGIYLIPTLVFLKWADSKEAASIASLFIVVNSASGLAGHLPASTVNMQTMLPLAASVFIGGYIGSKAGAARLKGETLQKIVAIIMLVAAAKLAKFI